MILTLAAAGSNAQQTVYKWVDEDGVVHFSDTAPAGAAEVETKTLAASPPAPAAQTAAEEPAMKVTVDEYAPTQVAAEEPIEVVKTNVAALSQPDLDLRCDESREAVIAPLREAEIASCKQEKRSDPAWCERYFADWGEGGRTIHGTMRPRMFDDLPECVDALQERNRRGI
jgi:hypothetical protein